MSRVSPSANLFEVAQALKQSAYTAGDMGNTQALQTWAELNMRAVSPCGKPACSAHTSRECKHCQPLGADGVAQVEKFLSQYAGSKFDLPEKK